MKELLEVQIFHMHVYPRPPIITRKTGSFIAFRFLRVDLEFT